MIQSVIQPAEVAVCMCDRAAAILQMQAANLDLGWVREYSISELLSCCERLAENQIGDNVFHNNIQRELIQNPNFASWLRKLKKTVEQEEMDREQGESPRWPVIKDMVPVLLENCWENKRCVTSYSQANVLSALSQERLSSYAQLAYLENFAHMDLFSEDGMQIADNLSACIDLPTLLTGSQKELLTKPFVSKRYLFKEEVFEEISTLFEAHPELTEFCQFLDQNEITEYFTLQDYVRFAEDTSEYIRLLTIMIHRIGKDAVAMLIKHWAKNGYALSELQRMEFRTREAEICNWEDVLATYSGYVNLFYGKRFKTIDLGHLKSYQGDILTYAIVHNKKQFIRLIDENSTLFFQLPKTSVLFQHEFYSEYFNLNALTLKDLADCAWMGSERLLLSPEANNREFTFPEIKLLHGTSSNYVSLYLNLRSKSVDYRIRVLRQILKRDALNGVTEDNDLSSLATMLDQKPLHNWRQEEFGHIQGLTSSDVVKMLIYFDGLRHLTRSIQCRTDAVLALRNRERLDQFPSMDTLKNDLFVNDPDWLAISNEIGLRTEFKTHYRDTIIEFLCKDGAGISRAYLRELNDEHRAAFCRVMKAELMGQFSQLKYYEGDLERELGCQVPPQVNAKWPENLSYINGTMEVCERDDFFSTMLLGTQPKRTCLSYLDGAYSHCLLACFDSNKKVLYAKKGSYIVGRACIRLTKYSLNGKAHENKEQTSKFDFVDLEDIAGSREGKKDDEYVTLFLERPYISGVKPEEYGKIKTIFVELAQRKAQELSVMPTLSMEYDDVAIKGFVQTQLSLYISASKAGDQYLDSLGGQASVSRQGCYGSSHFLLGQQAGISK